ncbi:hypothetical protein B0T16DRAFT_458723 [Cercophora newfieldiana]|uniref:Uncharacterized protein n=1 Tax=Cercophora newfieldiana TaxID=92897 RepID=A0AA39Y7J4_9PEZI|nr:hypothetical protein B0T16DRAFT_458723 [Cercophora newfieldiana]
MSDAMGLQLESRSQSSFEQHGPWPLHDSRFHQTQRVNIGAALLQAAALPVLNECLGEFSRAGKVLRQPPHVIGKLSVASKPPTQALDGSAGTSSALTKPPSPPPTPAKLPASPAAATPTAAAAALTSIQQITAGLEILTFPIKTRPPPSRPSLKRRRPDTDVDGFDTASLGCKKRRLRREFITSRLSHPFSSPATHILNREGVAAGDKRFLRLAAVVSARRLSCAGTGQPHAPLAPPPSPSSMMRRAAVINRFRFRLQSEAAERGEEDDSDAAAATNTAPLQTNEGVMADDARFPVTSGPQQPCSPSQPPPTLRIPLQTPLLPLTRARIQARASPPSSPAGLRPTEPAGPARRLSPSPRLRPLRSPELRTTRPLIDIDDVDDLDDDSVAFPTSEHESRYGDEPDDVYTDFGLMFGGEGDPEDDESAGELYEDYLDEVDGIPWNARC